MELLVEFIFNNEEYITLDDVERLVGMKESSIYNRVRFGHFPQPAKLEIRKAWRKSEIELYLSKIKEK